MKISWSDRTLGLAGNRAGAGECAREISPADYKNAANPNGSMDGVLEAAMRLKLLLGGKTDCSMVVVANLVGNDGAMQLTAKLGRSIAILDDAPVLVVDGNFRSPALHTAFGVPQEPGLANLIEESGRPEEVIHFGKTGTPSVLTAGAAQKNYASLLSSPRSSDILQLLRERFRYILIDVGVLLDCPEGMMLASVSDGVVAALATGIRKRHEVLRVQQQLELLEIRLFGIVLTQGVAAR